MNKKDTANVLVCVICGDVWVPHLNRCPNCRGLCTWGYEKGADPLSWNVTEEGWALKPLTEKFAGKE